MQRPSLILLKTLSNKIPLSKNPYLLERINDLSEVNSLREDIWYNAKNSFSYFLKDHPLAKGR
jgi:hypothetical protein